MSDHSRALLDYYDEQRTGYTLHQLDMANAHLVGGLLAVLAQHNLMSEARACIDDACDDAEGRTR